jgi:uncharacterized protein (DUF2461 family)
MFEDTRVVIRSRKSNDRQYNGHRQKDKQQSTKLYTEDRVIRTQLKQGVNSVTQFELNLANIDTVKYIVYYYQIQLI